MKLNIEKIAADWKERGFGCSVWTDSPGTFWQDYVHDVDELLMLLQGEMEFTLGEKRWKPKIGDEIFIPAKAVHSVKNTGKTPNRWLYGYRRT